ncbi:hypothetical protein [Altererythrobacter sp. ZODW24]|uniref:hypothetical protein n=1 Tax=Altererythrobacter sp. ZODW24 TaxID=2185142 RepID=UPI000DF74737|nr:hypothetical protein [Altererythrobacter sp. ZODW24]
MSNLTFADISATNIGGTDLIQTTGRDTIGHTPGIYVADSDAAALAGAHPQLVTTSQNGVAYRATPSGGTISAEIAGAAGDGTGDDRPAIASAHAYSSAIGASGIAFESAAYRIAPVPNAEIEYGQGGQPCYVVPVDAGRINGRGATFTVTSGRGLVCGWWYAGGITDLQLASDVAAGAQAVTLEAGLSAQLAVGDSVIWMLGDVPFDTPETYNWGIARVTEIAGDTVTLDKQIPEGFTLAPTLSNRHLRKADFARDLTISDITMETELAQVGVAIYGGERLSFNRIGSRNLSAATIGLHFVDGATLTDCWTEGVRITQASSGAAFSFAECRNIQLVRPSAAGARTMIRAEAGAEVQAIGARFENNFYDENGNSLSDQVKVFSASGRSRISLHDTTITGDGGYCFSVQSNGVSGHDGDICISGRTVLVHSHDPYQLPIGRMSGVLDMKIGGSRETYDLDKLRPYRRRFNLRDGQYLSTLGPSGLLVKCRVYVSPEITVGPGQQLQAFTLGRQGDNGGNVAHGSMGGIQPGVDSQLEIIGGTVGGVQWTERDKPLQIVVATPAGGGLENAAAFVEIEAWMAEPDGADWTESELSWRSNRDDGNAIEARFGGYDLPAIAAGGSTTAEFTIPDMAATDHIRSLTLSSGLSGLSIRSAEAKAGLASVVFENPTSGTIDKAPADIVIAFDHSSLGA